MTADHSAPAPSGSSHHTRAALSIIVVTHNSEKVLDGFIASLTDHPPRREWELIVYDNASGDQSVIWLTRHFSRARIIYGGENRGFAFGVNAATAEAAGDFLLLANPDISWGDGIIDHLLEFLLDHPRVAAVSPKLVFPDGRPQSSTRRFPNHRNIWFSRGTPWGRWLGHAGMAGRYTVSDPSFPSPVEALCAACLMVRRDVFEAVGGMDTGYFLYVEDTDFCRRIANAGWEVWIDPTVAVTHQWGGAVRRDPHLTIIHRQSIRRYFALHHSRKRVRNLLLYLSLSAADALTRIRSMFHASRSSDGE